MTATVDETVETREAWLNRAAAQISDRVLYEYDVPALRVSVGWPGGRSNRNRTIGQCWSRGASEDGVNEIFISPMRGAADTLDVLGTLAHEMIHAIDDCESNHRGEFARMAKAVGFGPKLTQSGYRSEELNALLGEIAEFVGPFPHAALNTVGGGSETPKKQTTRMLKVQCINETGYIIRMTQSQIDEHGTPFCGCCQAPMELAPKKEDK